MASVYPQARQNHYTAPVTGPSRLAHSMVLHASAALLFFAGIQIWGAAALQAMPGGRALPFIALAMLMGAALPFARAVQRRWALIAEKSLPCPALVSRFRRDRARLWQFALLVPPLWIGAYLVIAALVRLPAQF
jgi:hypothetical protein